MIFKNRNLGRLGGEREREVAGIKKNQKSRLFARIETKRHESNDRANCRVEVGPYERVYVCASKRASERTKEDGRGWLRAWCVHDKNGASFAARVAPFTSQH